ncbi:MAG: phenylalanine--tRNA ligase subunit alpha [Candidatus Taylorbacteria bacterium]|nr:phenylalanine--tRNA ligase subunit alpha [Candidatus Taylorbacteria bacterium]
MDKAAGGHPHPLTRLLSEAAEIFGELGFEIALGPEMESEYYNFDALNIPPLHPARDMWDTFWISQKSKVKNQNSKSGRMLLRTHTSPVQIRYMEKNKPPIRIISPGKVYRYEATDATHEAQFFQLEGLMIDKEVSLAHLRYVLRYFFDKLFDRKVASRFRPTYFPFVEPGLEIDMSCSSCGGGNIRCGLCKGAGWIEVMGAGLVHPKVLEAGGVDPRRYGGFAFGGGVDRLAMIKYGVPDIRLFTSADLRLTTQF